MNWSTSKVSGRLRAAVDSVPKPSLGAGTQSASLAGMLCYARDMAIVQQGLSAVLRGITAPAPHPEFGDDGYREDARETALEALDWMERWARWRNAHGWSSDDRFRCAFLGHLRDES